MQKKNAQEKLAYYLNLEKSKLNGTDAENDAECIKVLKHFAEDLRSGITTEDNDLNKILLKIYAKLNERHTMIEISTEISDKNLLAAGVLNTFTKSLKDFNKEAKIDIIKTSDENKKSNPVPLSPLPENKSNNGTKDAEKHENEGSSETPENKKGSDLFLQNSSNQTQNPQKIKERISRDTVLLKNSELQKLYQNAMKELEEESNKIQSTYSKLFEENFRLYDGDKVILIICIHNIVVTCFQKHFFFRQLKLLKHGCGSEERMTK